MVSAFVEGRHHRVARAEPPSPCIAWPRNCRVQLERRGGRESREDSPSALRQRRPRLVRGGRHRPRHSLPGDSSPPSLAMPLFEDQPAIAKSEKEWHQDGNSNECGRCRDEREPAETECVTRKCRRDSQPGCEQKNLIDPIHPLPSAYARRPHNVTRVFRLVEGAV